MKINKYIILAILVVVASILIVWAAYSFSPPARAASGDSMMIGVVCTDAEDEWKQEMYRQVVKSAKDTDFNVIQIDTERTLSAQIDAMRSLIVYGVDAIVLSPISENGWNYVVQEAYDADVKIIALNERMNAPEQEGVLHITYPYQEAAQTMIARLVSDCVSKGDEKRNIIEFKGLVGSSVSEQISKGIRNELADNDCYVMNFSYNADFMRSRAKEQINSMLRNNYPITTIVAHNDAMALGAIDALLESQLVPGRDVEIVAFGGGIDAIEALKKGYINYIAVCDLSKIGDEVVNTCRRLRESGEMSSTINLDVTIKTKESYGEQ